MAKTNMVPASVKMVRVPPLTRVQLDHALGRLRQAASTRLEHAVLALGPKPDSFKLTVEQRVFQIRSGAATLKAEDIDHYTRLMDAFDFARTKEQEKADRAIKAWNDAHDALALRIEDERQAVIDQLIMTNDGARALELIAQFASKA